MVEEYLGGTWCIDHVNKPQTGKQLMLVHAEHHNAQLRTAHKNSMKHMLYTCARMETYSVSRRKTLGHHNDDMMLKMVYHSNEAEERAKAC